MHCLQTALLGCLPLLFRRGCPPVRMPGCDLPQVNQVLLQAQEQPAIGAELKILVLTSRLEGSSSFCTTGWASVAPCGSLKGFHYYL